MNDNYGGGLYIANSGSLDLNSANNTITGNIADDGGGGIYITGAGELSFVNDIIFDNSAPVGEDIWNFENAASISIAHSDVGAIFGIYANGGGNINADPKAANPSEEDFHLTEGSPCIDAGKNEDWMSSAVDLDGNPRIFYGRSSPTVDMGAYEYGSWPFKVLQMNAPEGGQAFLTWKSRVGDTYTVWSCADLSTGVWVEEASVASQGASTSWTDPSATGQHKYYRIEMK